MKNPSDRTPRLPSSTRRRPSINYEALRTMQLSREDALRMALRSIDDSSPASLFQKQSLLLSMHPEDPLRDVWYQETAPLEARAELHLDGPTVQGHSADARQVARLISSITLSVKHDAASKLISRSGKLPHSPLLVEAFAPGSLEIVLKAAPIEAPEKRGSEPAFQDLPLPRHIISESLTTVIDVLTAASSDETPGSLDTRGLDGRALRSLHEAAQAVISETWEITGALTQRMHSPTPVKITPRGAQKLKLALEAQENVPTHHEITGTIAGFRESTGLVWIDVAGQEISMRAVENDLWLRARALSPDPDQLLRVRYVEIVRGFNGQKVSVSRTLRSLERID